MKMGKGIKTKYVMDKWKMSGRIIKGNIKDGKRKVDKDDEMRKERKEKKNRVKKKRRKNYQTQRIMGITIS